MTLAQGLAQNERADFVMLNVTSIQGMGSQPGVVEMSVLDSRLSVS